MLRSVRQLAVRSFYRAARRDPLDRRVRPTARRCRFSPRRYTRAWQCSDAAPTGTRSAWDRDRRKTLVKQEIIFAAALATLLLSMAAGVPAQSLVEIAQREKARRAAIAPEARSKVYTNDDLRDSGGLTIGASPAAAAQEADAGSGRAGRGIGSDGDITSGEPADGEVAGENEWRARMTSAQDARARAELMASALQNRADGLWAQFTAMDDPAPARRGGTTASGGVGRARTDAGGSGAFGPADPRHRGRGATRRRAAGLAAVARKTVACGSGFRPTGLGCESAPSLQHRLAAWGSAYNRQPALLGDRVRASN